MTIKKIKKKIRKKRDRLKRLFKRSRDKIYNFFIYSRYVNDPLVENAAVFTSRNGSDFGGNMIRLLEELYNRDDEKHIIYWAARKKNMKYARELMRNNGFHDVRVIRYGTLKYYKLLETSKYIFCDATLPIKYLKRDDQIYVNTWHGTPYKLMGNDSNSDRYNIGNVQRNFMAADYLIYPSEYCRDKMMSSYSIDEIYSGNVLMSGYPRNSIFFDEEKRAQTLKKYELEGKKVYIYMPTFRETSGIKQNTLQRSQIQDYMYYLDEHLKDDEVLFVKFHVFVKKSIDFSEYEHIMEFPKGVETYEFLNCADCLISDYSSVIYDFANAGRKIIRFIYDEEAYYSSRGFYDQPVEMPFPKAYTAEELLEAMQGDPKYDDSAFVDTFCSYDNIDAPKKIIDAVLAGNSDYNAHRKDYALVYNESVKQGIITENLDEIMEEYPEDKYMAFSKQAMKKKQGNFDNVSDMFAGTIGINTKMYKTFWESFAYIIFWRLGIDNEWVHKMMDITFEREYRRLLKGYPFDNLIYYQGNNKNMAELFAASPGRSTIYIYYNWLDKMPQRGIKRIVERFDRLVLCDDEMESILKERFNVSLEGKERVVNSHYV